MYFMDGKYKAFVPPEMKEHFSLNDLHQMAKAKGIELIENSNIVNSKFWKYYIKYINIKNQKGKIIAKIINYLKLLYYWVNTK